MKYKQVRLTANYMKNSTVQANYNGGLIKSAKGVMQNDENKSISRGGRVLIEELAMEYRKEALISDIIHWLCKMDP